MFWRTTYIPPDCKREMSTFHAIVKRLYGAFLYFSDSHETFQGNVWTFQGNVLTFGYPIYSNFICLLIYSGKIYAQFSEFHKWKCKWFRKMSLDFVTAGDQKDVINLFDVLSIPSCRILSAIFVICHSFALILLRCQMFTPMCYRSNHRNYNQNHLGSSLAS